jgi:hypothetical protein
MLTEIKHYCIFRLLLLQMSEFPRGGYIECREVAP